MTTHFITRHPGARDWARRRKLNVDRWSGHLDPDGIGPGDTVIGTLPVHLIWEVNRRGARYLHLSLDLPPELRGRELSADELEHCRARLEEYRVDKVEAA
jgi:CRISPR-associated protein Csx16